MGLVLPFVSFLALPLFMLVCSSSSSSSSSILSAGSGVDWASSLRLLFLSGVLVVVDSDGGSTWFRICSSVLATGGSDRPLVVMSGGWSGGVASFVDSVRFSGFAGEVGDEGGVSVASAVLSGSAVLSLC